MSTKAEKFPIELGAVEEMQSEDSAQLLEMVVLPPSSAPVEGIVVGRLIAIDEAVRVTFPGCADPLGVPARSMVRFDPRDQGADVALMFENGDLTRPCVLGRMALSGIEVARDGHRLVFSAEQEIVLQCGEASITLTRAGKVIIRGAYVVSASVGVNRILGGVVEIN